MGQLVNRSVSLRGDDEDTRVAEERREMAGDVERVREQWDQPTLKAWCEAYTNNKALLKEFTMRKEVWGWDLAGLEAAVKSAILSTGYTSNDLIVKFELDDREIKVLPNNLLSRIFARVSCILPSWNAPTTADQDAIGRFCSIHPVYHPHLSPHMVVQALPLARRSPLRRHTSHLSVAESLSSTG